MDHCIYVLKERGEGGHGKQIFGGISVAHLLGIFFFEMAPCRVSFSFFFFLLVVLFSIVRPQKENLRVVLK